MSIVFFVFFHLLILLQDGSLIDMKIIIEFKKALKEKKLFQFLTNELNLDNK